MPVEGYTVVLPWLCGNLIWVRFREIRLMLGMKRPDGFHRYSPGAKFRRGWQLESCLAGRHGDSFGGPASCVLATDCCCAISCAVRTPEILGASGTWVRARFVALCFCFRRLREPNTAAAMRGRGG